MNLKSIFLFGGTFDPVHLSHTRMVSAVLDKKLADEVWYLPVGSQHAVHFDTKRMASAEHRVAMLKLVLAANTRIELFEVKRSKPSYTDVALRSLSAQYPAYKFSWLFGSDQLAKLDLWYQVDGRPSFPELFSEFDFYVYPRFGSQLKSRYQQLHFIKDVPEESISSTEIRRRLAADENITDLVDPKVAAYIAKHHLYE